MNSVDLVAKSMQILGVVMGLVTLIFAVGKGWATVTATLATLKKMHERMDAFQADIRSSDSAHTKEIYELRIDIARIQTALGLKKPTLRIPAVPTGPETPMFTDRDPGEEE